MNGPFVAASGTPWEMKVTPRLHWAIMVSPGTRDCSKSRDVIVAYVRVASPQLLPSPGPLGSGEINIVLVCIAVAVAAGAGAGAGDRATGVLLHLRCCLCDGIHFSFLAVGFAGDRCLLRWLADCQPKFT